MVMGGNEVSSLSSSVAMKDEMDNFKTLPVISKEIKNKNKRMVIQVACDFDLGLKEMKRNSLKGDGYWCRG